MEKPKLKFCPVIKERCKGHECQMWELSGSTTVWWRSVSKGGGIVKHEWSNYAGTSYKKSDVPAPKGAMYFKKFIGSQAGNWVKEVSETEVPGDCGLKFGQMEINA